ncbi:hypothetical protein [Rhodopirellula sp. MGV]|uniref:hypothetical protein n=1 Tax=Rhodopirellula sp. MGV TaxID=2023130 RepID=UPI000B96A8FC|nr:hypothetical protein [Rhodopirellula sp. MGV]OYP36117.1 hypothetical protein CGZ80_10285 [Rhodopirellula sp. MGV]PNY36524.1 hypothetical protein C2E31_11715 [Rhodopirellula baltica]
MSRSISTLPMLLRFAFALAVILSARNLVVAQEAPADQPAANEKTPEENFSELLDGIEKDLDELEEKIGFGSPIVEDYYNELQREYRTLSELAGDQGDRDYSHLSESHRELVDRMNVLAISRWYLHNIASQALLKEADYRGTLQQMNTAIREHREAMRDPALSKRYRELMHRSTKLNTERSMRRYMVDFYFDRPHQSRSADPDDPQLAISIQKLSQPLGCLLQLRWNDGHLLLDRDHWKEPFAHQTLDQIEKDLIAELADRGVDIEYEDRSFKYLRDRIFRYNHSSLLFLNFKHQATAYEQKTQATVSVSNETQSLRFVGREIEASMSSSETSLDLFVRELRTPTQDILHFKTHDDGTLLIRQVGEVNFQFEQSAEGDCRWVSVADDVQEYKAKSFADLYREHPEKVDGQLFPFLKSIGIRPPPGRFDPLVVSRVIEWLKTDNEAARQEFERLLSDMESGSFSIRQQAFRSLNENLDKFAILIEQTSPDRLRSIESIARVEEIRKQGNALYKQTDHLIQSFGSLDDSQYLKALLPRISEANQAFVQKRIDELEALPPTTDRK